MGKGGMHYFQNERGENEKRNEYVEGKLKEAGM